MGNELERIVSLTAKKVMSFDDLLVLGIEVAMFENEVGNFAVVMRRDRDVKGILCISRKQADYVYKGCVKKAVEKYVCN